MIYNALQRGMKVAVVRKSNLIQSRIAKEDINQIFEILSWEDDGRQHNRYVCTIYIRNVKTKRETTAALDELEFLNPNFEPGGKFIVCVGCGATLTQDVMLTRSKTVSLFTCPSCGMVEPEFS